MTKVPSQFDRQKNFWILSSGIGFLIASYVLIFGLTIFNTIDRQRAESEIADLEAKVSELEFAYLAKKSSINEEVAESLGFVKATNIIVSRAKTGDVLTLK